MQTQVIQFPSKREYVYRLWSDNFDGELVTAEALEEITLTMSTGDFHTHKAKRVLYRDEMADDVMTLEDILEQYEGV